MANMDGDEWAHIIETRIGTAMKNRRGELGLSAQGLADRCGVEGYPISRSTIAKIESGTRGKVEVAELLVLSQALRVSPSALLWHDAPDGTAHYSPRYETTAGVAMREFSGEDVPFTAYDDADEVERQRARMATLRRVHTAELALRGAWGKYSGNSDMRPRIAALEVELREAQNEAASYGWTVDRGTFGPIKITGKRGHNGQG